MLNMAREKSKTPESTANLIKASENRLAELSEQLKSLKDTIKAEEKNLAELKEKLKQEKLNDIGSLAESAGVSIDALLSSLKEGSILSLISDNNANE